MINDPQEVQEHSNGETAKSQSSLSETIDKLEEALRGIAEVEELIAYVNITFGHPRKIEQSVVDKATTRLNRFYEDFGGISNSARSDLFRVYSTRPVAVVLEINHLKEMRNHLLGAAGIFIADLRKELK